MSANHPGRWTGRRDEDPVSWPARSPDLSPLHFLFSCESIWKPRFVPLQSILERNEGAEYLKTCKLLHAELSCISEHEGYFEHVFLSKNEEVK
jgi:hypothetical protein